MRTMGRFGCLLGAAAILALSLPAEAKISANKISANKLAGNKLAGNKLAGNKLSANKLSANKLDGDGAFTDVSVIEFPGGIRFTH